MKTYPNSKSLSSQDTEAEYQKLKLFVAGLFVSSFIASQILSATIISVGEIRVSAVMLFIAALAVSATTAKKMCNLVFRLIAGNTDSIDVDSDDAALSGEDPLSPYYRAALDNTEANIMVADADNNIVYMNEAVADLFTKNEAKIRQQLPHFNATELIGANMDAFHQNPDHQNQLINNLESRYSSRASIAGLTFSIIASPILRPDGTRLGTVVEWKDISLELAAEEQAIENSRLRQALDTASANIMVADADHVISYMNDTVRSMFRTAEQDIREAIPGFDVDKLVGQSMDLFHKNPAHQRQLVEGLTTSYTAPQANVGSRTFRITATPIFGADRQRLGTVVEWLDISAELAIEREVSEIVAGARQGDVGNRINMGNKKGFYQALSAGINSLLDVCDLVIGDIGSLLSEMSQGNLTTRIDTAYEGKFEQLKQDANRTVDRLIEVIVDIRNASNSVSVGADEISKGNLNLSQRTEEQSASLEETAASMEQMTATVQQNASNAQEADNLSSSAHKTAEHGGEVLDRAITAMTAIEESSKEISAIISVIDEIAYQTNLLALNASVEAARAGEQGRGFAVVAEEVRTLASRSAKAAQEIKTLIEDSSRKVSDGSSLVHSSGESLQEIIEAVKKVNTIVSEISTASVEQAAGIEEVNRAISQMDEITQQNAALVEESATAAESMSDQAKSLNRLIDFFKIS